VALPTVRRSAVLLAGALLTCALALSGGAVEAPSAAQPAWARTIDAYRSPSTAKRAVTQGFPAIHGGPITTSTGEIVDVRVSDALSQGLPTLVSNVVLLPTTVVVLFVVDWRLGLVAMVILPPTLVLTRWFQRKSAVAQLDVRNRIAAVTAQVAESVSGMAIIQAFNRERQFQAQFDELNAENRSSNVYAQQLFSVFFPSIELLGAISTCAVLGNRSNARAEISA